MDNARLQGLLAGLISAGTAGEPRGTLIAGARRRCPRFRNDRLHPKEVRSARELKNKTKQNKSGGPTWIEIGAL